VVDYQSDMKTYASWFMHLMCGPRITVQYPDTGMQVNIAVNTAVRPQAAHIPIVT
jgi:hypothetical protein